jgi:hypothetical protein
MNELASAESFSLESTPRPTNRSTRPPTIVCARRASVSRKQAVDRPVAVLRRDADRRPELIEQQFEVRSRDQRPREHPHLLVDVGLEREPGHQRLEHRLRVDVDARVRLVPLRHEPHDDGADDGDDPGGEDGDPPPAPDRVEQQLGFANESDHPSTPLLGHPRGVRTSFAE